MGWIARSYGNSVTTYYTQDMCEYVCACVCSVCLGVVPVYVIG